MNVRETGVDSLVTGGLKWLLGGPGVAYLYVRREVAARLQPSDVGWFAHRRQFDFDVTTFEYADGARRFEGGTPSVGPGLVRLSPYFYNTLDDCDRVVHAVADLERSGIAS